MSLRSSSLGSCHHRSRSRPSSTPALPPSLGILMRMSLRGSSFHSRPPLGVPLHADDAGEQMRTGRHPQREAPCGCPRGRRFVSSRLFPHRPGGRRGGSTGRTGREPGPRTLTPPGAQGSFRAGVRKEMWPEELGGR